MIENPIDKNIFSFKIDAHSTFRKFMKHFESMSYVTFILLIFNIFVFIMILKTPIKNDEYFKRRYS